MKTTPYEEGSRDAPIAVVGEAPGSTEIAQQRPLVGPSGMLFNQCLHDAGLVRGGLYITNVFPFQVRKNREGSEIYDPNGSLLWTAKRGFTEAADQHCAALYERLQFFRGRCVVALGGVSFEALTGLTQLEKRRGSLYRPDTLAGRKWVVGTYHPAHILRGNYLGRYLLVSDLEKIKRVAGNPKFQLPQRTFYIDPSYTDILAYLDSLKKVDQLAFDIEITAKNVSCLAFAPRPDEAMCVPFVGDWGKPRFSPEQEAAVWLKINEALSTPRVTKINHNILFDIHVLWYKNGIRTQGPLADTMAAHHILYPDFKKGLDLVTSVMTDEPYYKDEGKIWKKPIKDWPQFWTYNCKDAAVCREIWPELAQTMKEEGYWRTYELTVANYPWLLYCMNRGIQVDVEKMAVVQKRVRGEIEQLEAQLHETADYDFNWASAAQVKKYMYAHKGYHQYVHHKTGQPTVDDKALARLSRRYDSKEARLIQELRGLSKFEGTYLEIKFDEDNRLRCSYNPRGTKNGRLSSSETIFETGTNMQNLPVKFKDFLRADKEGKV